MSVSEPRYNRIGAHYDSTRKADPYLCSRMQSLLGPIKGGLYLDVGCGTGNYTTCLSNKGVTFIGIDPSEKMLTNAKTKNPNVRWMKGSAEQIDLDDEHVDGVLVSLSIHHWSDLKKGFQEISRVMKPGARLVLFTIFPEQTKGYWLTHYFPKMIEDSIAILPTKSAVELAFENAGLSIVKEEKYFVKPDLEDYFLYCGKHDPTKYLNPTIRNGISSFSLLANQPEGESGLSKLKSDIETGSIDKIVQTGVNDLGDYCFMVAQKR